MGFVSLLRSDIDAFAARSQRRGSLGYAIRYLSLTPGFYFVAGLRLQQSLAGVPIVGKPLRRVFWFLHSQWFGCEIAVSARIGRAFYVPHPYGIVIGGDAVIGDGVTVLQGVTIGIKSQTDNRIGRIEDGAFLGANACVIGDVTVGRGAVVGANAVVVKDVPAGASAVGNPARILAPKPPADQSRS